MEINYTEKAYQFIDLLNNFYIARNCAYSIFTILELVDLQTTLYDIQEMEKALKHFPEFINKNSYDWYEYNK